MGEVAEWSGAPAASPLSTPTYDGSGEAVHPDVVDFLEMHDLATWNGYRYWMGMTPYPAGADTYENPSILASNDGDTWEVPVGLTNPVWAPEAGFAPDPDLVYDPATGRLHLFWAGSRMSYSTDGVTWSEPTVVVSASGEVSPAVILDGSTWKMWSIDTGESPNTLLYRTASDPAGPWSSATVLDLQPWLGRDLWHIDVQKVDDGFYALISDCTRDQPGPDARLIFAVSDDGLDWSVGSAEVIPRPKGAFNATHTYRATLTPIYDGSALDGFDVWYSGRSAANAWRIGRTTIART